MSHPSRLISSALVQLLRGASHASDSITLPALLSSPGGWSDIVQTQQPSFWGQQLQVLCAPSDHQKSQKLKVSSQPRPLPAPACPQSQ